MTIPGMILLGRAMPLFGAASMLEMQPRDL
jgi:hypothetical protein